MTWHVETPVLHRYAAGTLDQASALSVESHVVACESCRVELAPLADRQRLDRVWDEVVATIDLPRPAVVERLLARLGVAEHLARLLAATPSLRLSWLAAMALCLAFAAVAAAEGGRGLLVFLVVAPLLPVAGVAAAFGPEIDPTYQIAVAAPLSSTKLLLVRSTAVLVTTSVFAGAAALVIPDLGWAAAAWLLPALGLTLSSLALATVVPPVAAAASVAATWVVVVTASERVATVDLAAFRGGSQLLYLAVAVVAGLVLARRRDAFELAREGA